jgi:hypothetical protein
MERFQTLFVRESILRQDSALKGRFGRSGLVSKNSIQQHGVLFQKVLEKGAGDADSTGGESIVCGTGGLEIFRGREIYLITVTLA